MRSRADCPLSERYLHPILCLYTERSILSSRTRSLFEKAPRTKLPLSKQSETAIPSPQRINCPQTCRLKPRRGNRFNDIAEPIWQVACVREVEIYTYAGGLQSGCFVENHLCAGVYVEECAVDSWEAAAAAHVVFVQPGIWTGAFLAMQFNYSVGDESWIVFVLAIGKLRCIEAMDIDILWKVFGGDGFDFHGNNISLR